MFHPSDPNFFLSNMIAWKKHSPNTIFRQSELNAIVTILDISFKVKTLKFTIVFEEIAINVCKRSFHIRP